jgi:type I restriction enzyme M protein
MLALLAPSSNERILDVGCGEGAFLRRAYQRSQTLYPNEPQHALSQLYGVDYHRTSIQQTLAHLATDSGIPLAQLQEMSQINCTNFLDAHFRETAFPSSLLSSPTSNQTKSTDDTLTLFDCIIGNPPYIRQETLRQDTTLNWDEDRRALRNTYVNYLNAYPQQAALWGRKLDSTMAFFMQAQQLLKPNGRLIFITSNSWLNSVIGEFFRRFLHHFFEIQLLAESACERWFPDASINALIILLKKRPHYLLPTNTKNHSGNPLLLNTPIRTVRFLRPLHECFLQATPDDDYWQQLSTQAAEILHGDWLPTQNSKTMVLGQLPTSSLPQLSENALSETTKPDTTSMLPARNWALALRAPLGLWHWLERETLWQRLDRWGKVRYPLKTGINQFFYLTRQQAEERGIEAEFLQPVIRSARRVQSWVLESDRPPTAEDDFLFVCSEPANILKAKGKTGALEYIAWGETQVAPPRQKRAHPTPWPDVVSVRNNHPWYAIRPFPPTDLLCNRFLDSRFFFALCKGGWMEDQTFYGLSFHPTVNETFTAQFQENKFEPSAQSNRRAFVAALLNSTLSFTLLEFILRGSLGDGVLQASRGDMASLPVANPALYNGDERAALAEAFYAMAQRPIFSLEKELQQPDRLTLDVLVLSPIAAQLPGRPSATDYRNVLVSALLERFHERRHLSRNKATP